MYSLKTKNGNVVKTSLNLDRIKEYAQNFLKENKEPLELYDENNEKISDFKILRD